LGDAEDRKQIKKMFDYTKLIVLSLIEGFILLYMGSILILIVATTHDEDVNDENRSSNYDPLSMIVCFSSLFFASCIWHFFLHTRHKLMNCESISLFIAFNSNTKRLLTQTVSGTRKENS